MFSTQPVPSSVNYKREAILLKIFFWCFVIDQRLWICKMISNEIIFKVSAEQFVSWGQAITAKLLTSHCCFNIVL